MRRIDAIVAWHKIRAIFLQQKHWWKLTTLRTAAGEIQDLINMSNEKRPGWLGYIGDYTTQVYRDYNKPL